MNYITECLSSKSIHVLEYLPELFPLDLSSSRLSFSTPSFLALFPCLSFPRCWALGSRLACGWDRIVSFPLSFQVTQEPFLLFSFIRRLLPSGICLLFLAYSIHIKQSCNFIMRNMNGPHSCRGLYVQLVRRFA